jgi:hypothetical protein
MANAKKPPIKKRSRKKQVLMEMERERTTSLPFIRQSITEHIERKYGEKQ